MNYISLDNLTRYHRNFRNYGDATYALTRGSLWKQTEKAGAVTCWPIGNSRLKPVVEFKFKETLPVSDKSEQNPSTITGVNNIVITRCGKNLMPVNTTREAVDWGVARHGIITNKISDAVVSLTGKATQDTGVNLRPRLHLPNGLTYTLSGADSDARVNGVDNYWLVIWQHGSSSTPYDRGNGCTFLKNHHDAYDMLPSIGIKQDYEFNNKIIKIQIELNTSKTEFESPISNTYNIQLNSTYYGGILDVSTGKLTVTHRMIEADSLTLDISNYPAYLPLDCTDTFGRTITSTGNILALTGSTGGKIVYKLANPYTVQIDPVTITALPQVDKYTPRINTLYTDTENITVGYQKSPIRDEYEKVQAIIANGGTI